MMKAMGDELRVAYLQQDIVWEDAEANFHEVEVAFERALTGREVDVLVVPETFSTGFSDRMRELAEEQEGPSLAFAREMARRHDALFVGSWAVKDADGLVRNRMHAVRPDGTWEWYDKAHTFRMSTEALQLERGKRRETMEWRGWRLRLAVCYDLRFPTWLRNELTATGRMQKATLEADQRPEMGEEEPLAYDVLVVVANWPDSRHETWTTLLEARAIENQSYVVGVNRVGTDGLGIGYSGHSAVYDFRGRMVSAAEAGREEVAVTCLDRKALRAFRQHWPFYLDFD